MAVSTTQGGYLNFNTYQPEYIGRPVQALGQMMGTLDNSNRAILDRTSGLDIALSNLDIAPEDEAIRLNRRNQMQSQIQELVDSGDYGLAEARIAKMSRDFQTDKDLQQALVNKQAYDAYRNELKDRRDKGFISEEAYRAGLQSPYQAVAKQDGMYVTPNYYDYARQVDMNPVLARVVQSLPKDVKQSLVTPITGDPRDPNYNPFEVLGEHQRTTSQRNINTLKLALEDAYDNTPGAKAFINDQARALLTLSGQEVTPENIEAKSNELMTDMVSSYVLTGGAPQYQDNILRGNTADLRTAQYKEMLKNREQGGTAPYLFPAIKNGFSNILTKSVNKGIIGDTDFGTFSPYGETNPEEIIRNRVSNRLSKLKSLDGNSKDLSKNDKRDLKALQGFIKYKKPIVNGQVVNSLNDLNENNYNDFANQYENYMNTEFIDKLNSNINASYTDKNGRVLASDVFGGYDFTRDSTGDEFNFSDSFGNYVMYDMETGEVIESKDDMRERVREYGEGDKTLRVRAKAELNSGNPIPQHTGNYSFTDGTVYNANGHEFVLAPRFKENSRDIIQNIAIYSSQYPVEQEIPKDYLKGLVPDNELANYNAYFITNEETGGETEFVVEYKGKNANKVGTSDLKEIERKFAEKYSL